MWIKLSVVLALLGCWAGSRWCRALRRSRRTARRNAEFGARFKRSGLGDAPAWAQDTHPARSD